MFNDIAKFNNKFFKVKFVDKRDVHARRHFLTHVIFQNTYPETTPSSKLKYTLTELGQHAMQHVMIHSSLYSSVQYSPICTIYYVFQ